MNLNDYKDFERGIFINGDRRLLLYCRNGRYIGFYAVIRDLERMEAKD